MSFIEIPDSDLAQYACEKTVMIGKTPVTIKPPSLMMLPRIAPQISRLFDKFRDSGITIDNYVEHMDTIVETVIEESIGLYELLTGISKDSLVKIPSAAVHMELIEAVLHVNIVSQEGFSKNWIALAEAIRKMRNLKITKKISGISSQH